MNADVGYYGTFNGAMAGLSGGFAPIVEKKGRRIELGLYMLTFALESAYRYFMKRGWAGVVPYGELGLFVGSSAIILHAFVSAPQRLRPSYRSLCTKLLGGPPRHVNAEAAAVARRQQQKDDNRSGSGSGGSGSASKSSGALGSGTGRASGGSQV